MVIYTDILKMDNQQGSVIANGTMFNAGAAYMGGKFGGQQIHVCVWLNPFSVPLITLFINSCITTQRISKGKRLLALRMSGMKYRRQ